MGQVEALVNLKLCADVHLGEEVDRNWWEILHHTYVFDRLLREVSITEAFVSLSVCAHMRLCVCGDEFGCTCIYVSGDE